MLTTGSLAVFLVAGGAMVEPSVTEQFVGALLAPGPLPADAGRMKLYEPLLGDWLVDVVDYAADGTPCRSTGEWHFAWVLEGRAIQDVWISPPRGARHGAPVADNRYGTTLRIYDPGADVWRVTWFNPVSGITNSLVGRAQGDRIVQEGTEPDGRLTRWTFKDLSSGSFHWLGEESADGGRTWRLGAEFFGHRRVPEKDREGRRR